jgi:5-methylcytosine-specific restriction endonuclease McrA
MKPFDKYPNDGVSILQRQTETNARHGYGLQLQKLTGQSECAYCGVDLISDYYRWLLLSVDHVIPLSECKRLGIPEDWAKSYSNMVISCLGCNWLDNRYEIQGHELKRTWALEQFFVLRNAVFNERKQRIQESRMKELQFYNSHPWIS